MTLLKTLNVCLLRFCAQVMQRDMCVTYVFHHIHIYT
jgi:hypothetical protein